MQHWPEWWNYPIVISPHLIERMQERDFTEIDLRTMLDDATAYRPSLMPGRFLIETRLGKENWELIVEPDELEKALIIVTAYRIESP